MINHNVSGEWEGGGFSPSDWGRLEDDWALSETAGVEEAIPRTGGVAGRPGIPAGLHKHRLMRGKLLFILHVQTQLRKKGVRFFAKLC